MAKKGNNWTKKNRRGTLFIVKDGPLWNLIANFVLNNAHLKWQSVPSLIISDL